ncbi:MAG: undecaprenyl-diphosphate phosphatase [Treponema sp.]|jgi:undecaprenyl-diphosphatase|nr:undecaprenyl-diphosphate phosphatase [Treponema sp.]
MSVITAVILGAVQGITEFLPVSSSGHLVLLQKIFGITEPVLFFDIMVHVGTLAAVFAVLKRDIWDILRRIIQPLTGYLVTGTLPAVIAALVFRDYIEKAFASGAFLGFAFLITSAMLALSELACRNNAAADAGNPGTAVPADGKTAMKWSDALVIGIFQAAAIVPGISRSGATLSGSLFRKLDRNFAARFSFLLSIPAIVGALVLQLKDMAGGAAGGEAAGIGAAPLIAGTLTAAVVGFFSIRLMLKIIRERSLIIFAIYTAALGVLALIDTFGTHLFL